MLDHKLEPKASVARRVEVFTGTGHRRRWSSDEKARILEETLAVGAVVSEVARRHGITSQQRLDGDGPLGAALQAGNSVAETGFTGLRPPPGSRRKQGRVPCSKHPSKF